MLPYFPWACWLCIRYAAASLSNRLCSAVLKHAQSKAIICRCAAVASGSLEHIDNEDILHYELCTAMCWHVETYCYEAERKQKSTEALQYEDDSGKDWYTISILHGIDGLRSVSRVVPCAILYHRKDIFDYTQVYWKQYVELICFFCNMTILKIQNWNGNWRLRSTVTLQGIRDLRLHRYTAILYFCNT